jgi:hypothetical protein
MEIVKDSEVKSVTVLNDLPILPSPGAELARIETPTRDGELQTPLRDAMDTHDLKSIKSNAKSASSRTDNESESESDSEESFTESESDSDSESAVDVDETSGKSYFYARASKTSLEWIE